jgi:predicted polyphosphate/ATP-dependent NAD kinase
LSARNTTGNGSVPGRVGLLVNPVAGLGGRTGLHGTDGEVRLAEATRRGGAAVSTPRAVRALRRLGQVTDLSILAAPGPMGADIADACGIATDCVGLSLPAGRPSTAADTRAAARLLAAAGVDLLLFAGGDGTARDIAAAVGPGLPLLGIPSGVKMRSGVFGTSPESAADLASDFLRRPDRPCAEAEILDAAGDDGLGTEFYAVGTVPSLGHGRLAGAKSTSLVGSRAEFDALCAAVAADLSPGTLYLFGPGTTTGGVLHRLGIAGTALGVDAVRDGELIGADLPEHAILTLMEQAASTKLVLGVIGGQGFLLGRGNQQLSPDVLARLSPEDLWIIAAAGKLTALDPPVLLLDVGDEAAFRWLDGYHRVRVGPARYMVMRVAAAA